MGRRCDRLQRRTVHYVRLPDLCPRFHYWEGVQLYRPQWNLGEHSSHCVSAILYLIVCLYISPPETNSSSGNSTVATELNTVHLTLAQKWNNLPSGARIGIISGASALVGLSALTFLFCCIRQRRIGKREWNAQNNKWTQERTEMMNMQAEWRQKGYVEMK